MHRHVVAILAALALATGCTQQQTPPRASGPGTPASEGFPVTLTDDEGAEITLESPPERIVTFAPSHTEIVFALGLGDRVVGVSGAFDDYPEEAKAIDPVAGPSGVEPNIEKVVSLEPDVVLTGFIGGEWKEDLRGVDVPVFTTLAQSFDDALADIETIGRVVGTEERARTLAADIEAEAEAIEERLGDADPVTCFLDLGDLYTVGPGTLEFDLLHRAGCEPITATAGEPYPQWSLEQLVQDDPDVYLVSEGVPIGQVRKQEGVRELTAVREDRIRQVTADLISRPGPRIAQGIEHLASALHGE